MPSISSPIPKTPSPTLKSQILKKKNKISLAPNGSNITLLADDNNANKSIPNSPQSSPKLNSQQKVSLLKEQIHKNKFREQISKMKQDTLNGLDSNGNGKTSPKLNGNKDQLDKVVSNQGKPLLHRLIKFRESDKQLQNDDLKLKYKPINDLKKLGEIKSKMTASSSDASKVAIDDNILAQPKDILYSMEKLNSILTWKQVSKIGSGLNNIGNTCFMNSVLQCLTYSPPLANFMKSQEHSKTCSNSGFCVFCSLEKQICLSLSSGRSTTPKEIAYNIRKIAPSFRLGRQEDSHEFIRFVIEGLQKVCLSKYPKGTVSHRDSMTTIVASIFGGYLRSQVKCSVCNYESNTFDPFMDLSVDINHSDSLQKALTNFVKPETLDNSNKYKCSKCKKLVKAQKQLKIQIAPPILTIQLKRFNFMGMFGGKINKPVQFDPVLNLSPFMTHTKNNVTYDLYGVLVHLGGSTSSGHYFCFVKNSNGVWHKCDDDTVTQVSLETVLSQKAYILFYSKRPSPDNISTNSITINNINSVNQQPISQAPIINKNGKRLLPIEDVTPIITNDKDISQPKKQIKLDNNSNGKIESPKLLPSTLSPTLVKKNLIIDQLHSTTPINTSNSDSGSESESSLSSASLDSSSESESESEKKPIMKNNLNNKVNAKKEKVKSWEDKLDDIEMKEMEIKKLKAKKVASNLKLLESSKEGSQFQFQVAKWDQEDVPMNEENAKAQRELLQDESLKEVVREKDSWNEEFDKGRVKKIKLKKSIDPNESNQFDILQAKKIQQKEHILKHGEQQQANRSPKRIRKNKIPLGMNGLVGKNLNSMRKPNGNNNFKSNGHHGGNRSNTNSNNNKNFKGK